MRNMSFILIAFLLFVGETLGQVSDGKSPHGKDLKIDCSNCHASTSWKEIPKNRKFDHNITGFNLAGQHANVDCNLCHKSLVFSEAKSNCISCHHDIHANSVSLDCENCHTPKTWLVTNINEIHQRSRFPLLGAHSLQDCASCHTKFASLDFQVMGVECVSCHRKDYVAAKNPDHLATGFSTDCQDCHQINQRLWTSTKFAHDFFPLTGGHKIQDCFSCHKQGTFQGLSTDCSTCHMATFKATTNPNHVQGNFGTNCIECHNINSWSPAQFDHNSTAFPLTGAHKTVSCNSCHTTGYQGIATNCYSCHKANYESTTNPNHVAQGFPTNCLQCHSTKSWSSADFDHNSTAFPLTGAHKTISCASCHTNGYQGTSTDCYSCHKSNYESTTDPNHVAQGFPTTCQQCHSTTSWSSASFDHNTTAFPLTGAHKTVSCASCHKNGYQGTSTDCYSCHKSNYESTTDPNHVAQGFPTTCQQCHSTTSWSSASFDHNTTAFPLTGAHKTVSCASCHSNGYQGTSTDCYSCHKSNYDGTTNPNHAAANFPTTCTQCHNSNAWVPATYDHDNQYFPIYSGKHNGKWNACTDCHTNQNNYMSHTCNAVCHKSDHHQDEDCYSCHPTGRER